MKRIFAAPLLLPFVILGCSSNETSSPSLDVDSGVVDAEDAGAETDTDADTGPLRSSCGNVRVLGPQHAANTPECVACFDANCCAEGTACGEKASCVSLRECLAECASSDEACKDVCWNDYGDAETESGAMATCRNTHCSAECADMACVGSVVWPEPTKPTYSFQLRLVELQSGSNVVGATVKVCELDDDTCAAPLSSTTSDGDGLVNVTAPTARAGIAAYLEISGAEIMTTVHYIRFTNPDLDGRQLYHYVVGKGTFEALAALTGVTPDPSRGTVAFVTQDCAKNVVAGISASVASADASSTTLYIEPDGLPSTSAPSSSRIGFGAVVNVPAGATTIRGTIEATGQELGAPAPILVRAGAVTSINLVPSP